ncbi:hypothetical protein SAMN05444161_3356 [Rhizobiales bacterium GAS191]|nr:hypothetical protein SAMN05444161_3356 [Rhizobiales bacterium GAS191]
MRQSFEPSSRLSGAGKVALAFALLLGASQFATSVPAHAQAYKDGGVASMTIGPPIAAMSIRLSGVISSAIRAKPAAARRPFR